MRIMFFPLAIDALTLTRLLAKAINTIEANRRLLALTVQEFLGSYLWRRSGTVISSASTGYEDVVALLRNFPPEDSATEDLLDISES